jgi:hypothetical protein
MAEPSYRVCIHFRYGARGCVWAANEATMARFPTEPLERYMPLSPATRQLLQRLHGQSDGHSDTDKYPWSDGEWERFSDRVQRAVSLVQAELGPEYEVEYREE